MQAPVREILDIPNLVLSDDVDEETIEIIQSLVESIKAPATDDEAVALVRLLSKSDDSFFGLNWELVHFIETAPNWPIWPVLDECKGAWSDGLRAAAENSGFAPYD